MQKVHGEVRTVDSVAYVAQQAWIQNATLRNNVLFGGDLLWARYQEVVGRLVCCVSPHAYTRAKLGLAC